MPNRPKRTSKSGKNRTSLEGHTRQGNILLPPFLDKMPGTTSVSWMNDRLPEMVWAALIRVAFEREQALGYFRRILNFIGTHEKKAELNDVTLTGISKLNPELRRQFIAFIVERPSVAHALSVLRLFEGLPARDDWHDALPKETADLSVLMNAVGATLWHQSLESTDCRWMRLMAQIVSGRYHIPSEMAAEFFKYPNQGDQRDVRPSIRAAEMAPLSLETPDLTWPRRFWDEAWSHTPCFAVRRDNVKSPVEPQVTRQMIQEVERLLRGHWEETHVTTAIDARHDAIFGMAFYCLNILNELFTIGIASSILGRLGLRTILEVRVNLRYLISKNDDSLWKKWRTYGASQAKLSALKFDGIVDAPQHINVESIEYIAGEDIWEEMLAINLAGWSGIDLRRMSEQAQVKDSYDQHYGWTSGYAHGMWGAVRESCFATCVNPLHRLHRYPESQILPEVIHDAVILTDNILEDLDNVFPTFNFRLVKKTS